MRDNWSVPSLLVHYRFFFLGGGGGVGGMPVCGVCEKLILSKREIIWKTYLRAKLEKPCHAPKWEREFVSSGEHETSASDLSRNPNHILARMQQSLRRSQLWRHHPSLFRRSLVFLPFIPIIVNKRQRVPQLTMYRYYELSSFTLPYTTIIIVVAINEF